MDQFEARALQMAFDLTIRNTYEGKVGQGYNEARAHDIRRLYNILCGRGAEEHSSPAHLTHNPLISALAAPAKAASRKKKTDAE